MATLRSRLVFGGLVFGFLPEIFGLGGLFFSFVFSFGCSLFDRGGTDGANLSFKGLLCPNIFVDGLNSHGKMEFVPLESMEKASCVSYSYHKCYAVLKKHLKYLSGGE